MYEYILFDLDNTLLDFNKAEAISISAVLGSYGIVATPKIIENYSKINLSCWKRFEKGEIAREDIFKDRVNLLGDSLGTKFDYLEFTKKYVNVLSHQGHTFPETLPLLKTLRKTGYKMAAATNGSLIPQIGRITASGIAGFFSYGIFISEVIGHKKPEYKFFEFVLNKIGVTDKSKVLMIGDSLSGDILGAAKFGIDSCFVDFSGKEVPSSGYATYVVHSLNDIIPICGL